MKTIAQSSRRAGATLLFAAWFVVSAAGVAGAQQAVTRAGDGPHYAAMPIDIQIVASGFDESPAPEVAEAPTTGGRLQLAGVAPNVSTSIQVINGRMTQSKTVRYVFNYRFTADRPGQYRIGPFRIVQGAKETTAGAVTLSVGEVPVADGQRIRVLVPPGAIYLGQRVPVTVEWLSDSSLNGKLLNQTAEVPLFGMIGQFRFEDPEAPTATSKLVLGGPSGPAEYPAIEKVRTEGGRQYVVRSASRTMIPLKIGTFRIAPATLIVDEAVRWRRDLFGSRIATHVRKQRAVDIERQITVLPLPKAGKPRSFSGTVGGGFAIDVAADRSVVQVGDPIELTITLRGDSAVRNARLPKLQSAGLSAERFHQLPGKTTGSFDGEAKTFKTTIRVLDAEAREIPPIEFSWFDVDKGTYQTTASRPIALSVKDAKIVGASDVVRGDEDADDGAEAPMDEDARRAAVEARDTSGERSKAKPSFTLTGADLAIERDTARLAKSAEPSVTGGAVGVALYLLGLGLLVVAVLGRRRDAVAPEERRRRAELAKLRQTVASASDVGAVGDALRRIAAETRPRERTELDAVLADCDNLAFAPSSDGAVDAALRERAIGVADRLIERAGDSA